MNLPIVWDWVVIGGGALAVLLIVTWIDSVLIRQQIEGLLIEGQFEEARQIAEGRLMKMDGGYSRNLEIIEGSQIYGAYPAPDAALLPRGLRISWPMWLALLLISALFLAGVGPMRVCVASLPILVAAGTACVRARHRKLDEQLTELERLGRDDLIQLLARNSVRAWQWDPIRRCQAKEWVSTE